MSVIQRHREGTDKFEKNWRFETRAIHAGQESDPVSGAIVTPIYQTSTYEQEDLDKNYIHGKSGNPTRVALERCIASLENGKYGFAFATGWAACSAVTYLLSPGDHAILGNDIHGGIYHLFETLVCPNGVEVSWVDVSDIDRVEKAIRPNTKILWVETPTNPTLKLADIKALTALAKKHGLLTVVDNTFATPCFQQPLSLGADLVIHSTTKYLNGHSDVLGGAIVTARDDLSERFLYVQKAVGAIPSPFDCFLVLRGIKTLSLRVREHEKNATAVARFLSGHPAIETVFYPGLPSHPQFELARRQLSGFGGVVSCVVKGGLDGAKQLLNNVQLFALAEESQGGHRSLICHPSTMTHKSVAREAQEEHGIKQGLLRISVGLEHPQDLIDDLARALRIVELFEGARTGAKSAILPL
jgi:cystathionine beta-lyase/cystathionine gamma-synthase